MLGFEVDSFVHEVRALDYQLTVSSKVDQSEAVFVCTVMQAVSPNSRLVYCFPSDLSVRILHHRLHTQLLDVGGPRAGGTSFISC
jgi:hypothetical protein